MSSRGDVVEWPRNVLDLHVGYDRYISAGSLVSRLYYMYVHVNSNLCPRCHYSRVDLSRVGLPLTTLVLYSSRE